VGVKYLRGLAAAGVFVALGFGSASAQEQEAAPATPIELYACNYNDGYGPAHLDVAAANWNAWADEQGFSGYSAWTLVPYYFGPNYNYDFLWLGGSASAKSLGAVQDTWLAEGGEVQQEFARISSCSIHANFAALQFKAPAEREDSTHVVIAFSDCAMSEGTNFNAIGPALAEWGSYLDEQGSSSGMWVLFPAYGGGGEEFDFKFVQSYANYEDQGADWDQYSASGWQKADELFAGKLDCDSSRVYSATNRRMAESDD
jgi:hypothetical protein